MPIRVLTRNATHDRKAAGPGRREGYAERHLHTGLFDLTRHAFDRRLPVDLPSAADLAPGVPALTPGCDLLAELDETRTVLS
ncbi:hypothetical protein [Amycolatopsis sp. lyj-84]|uniref:hypothetical protein n=1 Tax=Amycolatopsis sp. lyj-84 TaxID=2789284 RepID=UPI00397CA8DD